MKESHGSVEVNALASAREINEKGIYSVGNLSTSQQSACRKVCSSVLMHCEGVVALQLTLQTLKCTLFHRRQRQGDGGDVSPPIF